jgi:hypothetical protein
VVALLAEFEPTDQGPHAAREPRRRLRLLASARGVDEELLVMVMNLSRTGMLIDAYVPLSVGELLDIELPEAGVVTAHIVWTSGTLSGCEFRHVLPRAAVIAAQLLAPHRLPARAEVSIVEPDLDRRIQRARRDHSLVVIAALVFLAVPLFAVLAEVVAGA